MGLHGRTRVAAAVSSLALSVLILCAKGSCAKDERGPVVPTKVFLTGNEQAVIDSFADKTKAFSAEQFPNSLDHVFTVLLSKAYPQPDPEKLARNAVISICEIFQRQTRGRISDEERERWISTALRGKSFESVLKDIETRRQEGLDRKQLIDSGLKGMIGGSEPPFAWLLGGVEAAWFKEMLKARKTPAEERGIIGVNLGGWPVVEVLPDSPAAKVGLQNGDLVLAVDGEDASGVKTMADALKLLRGPAGKKVTLRVRRGRETLAFEVRRAPAAAAGITANVVEPGILCVKIPTFEGAGIADKVKEIIHERVSEGARVVILDLRDSPGGRAKECHGVADIFLDDKLLLVLEFLDGERIAFKSNPGALDVEVIVLVNKASGCGGEALGMALRDNNQGTIVGETTAGALFAKDIIELENGQIIIFRAAATVLSPKGNDYSKVGVSPDILVPDARGPSSDAILRAAIEFARTKIRTETGQERLSPGSR